MTSAVIATRLETLLNLVLRLDPDTQARLAALEGSVIAIKLEGFGLTLYLLPGAHGIRVLDQHAGEPTVHIRGSLLALARQWRGQKTAGDGITIEGDTAVGREFQTALARLDIDWEEPLSRLFGDSTAHRIGRFWREFQTWGQRTGDRLGHNGGEYLQHELRVLPPRPAVEQFLSAVDTLREDTDRLAARIERLRRQSTTDDPI
ncbi:MAG: SCP2 sterol-binding domain-containing protein [Candidatus Contendobacter sp.]|nr:SCP2 sterol-binding domain-containing protein [Candidatus Contendobacter sp.]MDG4557528.1 SCP2 sterol-binding domain-containing protein [Candidatus Contendobacter sp.]